MKHFQMNCSLKDITPSLAENGHAEVEGVNQAGLEYREQKQHAYKQHAYGWGDSDDVKSF